MKLLNDFHLFSSNFEGRVFGTNSFPSLEHIVTCYLRSQPIQRFVAGQQLRSYATVLETLLGSRPRINNRSTVGRGVFYVVRAEELS
jgi:hypothetical protein